jgi:acyl-CoA reductase-like NAD-dependent aldehyde dehydrogenase
MTLVSGCYRSTMTLLGARQPFIDGKFVTGDGPPLHVENPATEQVIADVETSTSAQAEQAIFAARRSFDDGVWSGLAPRERVAVLERFVEFLVDRTEDIVDTVVAEAGCSIGITRLIQVGAPLEHAAATLDLYLQLPEEEYNRVPSTSLLTMGGSIGVSFTRYEPAGVVSAITAYNFPFYLDVAKAVPALVAGNSVVLRPSPLTPLSALVLGEAADAAGIPPGVLNVLVDEQVDVGVLMTSHPAVDMVTFTGSTVVGRQIMAQAAATVKKVHLELGGKSAQVFLPDAVEVAPFAGWAVFTSHAGQGCAIGTRLLVPADRKDDVMAQIAELAATTTIGDPTDPATVVGPLISAAQRDKSERYCQLAVEHGAKVICGGRRPPHLDRGYFWEPTLLDAPDNANPAAQDEIFGPVLTVLAYDDVDQAVAIANDTIYGLAGYVYGRDVVEATKVGQRLRAGTVWVNAATPSAYAPFGGYKQSGVGREMGEHGLREYQEVKHLMVGQLS